MTSIAANLAALTGAAPKEGQKGTPANAAGGVGLFTALLESSEALQGVNGETALTPDTLGTSIPAPSGQVPGEAVENGTTLSEALANGLGLPQGGADIDAAIVEAPQTGQDGPYKDEPVTETLLTGNFSPLLPSVQSEGKAPPPRNAQPPVQQPAVLKTLDLAEAVPILQKKYTPVEISPQQKTQAPGETAVRPSGLENALERVSQPGRENGLQAALSRTPQARGPGESQQTGTAQRAPGTGEAQLTGAAPAGAAKSGNISGEPRSGASGATESASAENPGRSRSEFASKGPETIQRLVSSGNGQSIIQIQTRPGGETAGASSPPTLTVSVQAPVASPGPASANAPHVPVSALAVTIATQANNGARRFDIRLDPPELGRIEVRLDVSRKGQVTTHLVVERPETLDLLQRDARQLERALQDAGLNTSEEDIKFSLQDQGLAQDGGDDFNDDDDTGARTGISERDDPSLIPDDAMPPPTRYLATSGLDIRI